MGHYGNSTSKPNLNVDSSAENLVPLGTLPYDEEEGDLGSEWKGKEKQIINSDDSDAQLMEVYGADASNGLSYSRL